MRQENWLAFYKKPKEDCYILGLFSSEAKAHFACQSMAEKHPNNLYGYDEIRKNTPMFLRMGHYLHAFNDLQPPGSEEPIYDEPVSYGKWY